jgi:putative ABC transport system permease protein
MATPQHTNPAIAASVRIYTRLLLLYPASFRRDCGQALAATFQDLAADRHRASGWRGLTTLWAGSLRDLLREATAERWAAALGRPSTLSAPPGPPTTRSFNWRKSMSSLLQDLRFAMRALTRSRGYAVSVIGTMALGIGAVTTMFTLLNGVLLRPLPFDGSERVVQLCETSPKVGSACVASPANVADLAQQSTTLEAAGVARGESFNLDTTDGRVPVRGAVATPGFFAALGIHAATGRLLVTADLPEGANGVALVSHAFWQSHMGGAADAVGSSIHLDGRDVLVVGVLPEQAFVPLLEGVDLWKPITASIDDTTDRAWRGFEALGRARPGVSRAALATELGTLHRALVAAYPEANDGWTLAIAGLRDQIVRPVRSTLWLFQAAALLLLGIACANVAGLLLVRGMSRDAEFAIRTALGAGRGRLVRQLLAEGLLVSVAGAIAGLPLAALATQAVVRLAPPNVPRLAEVTVDGRVALVTFGVAALTALIFGLVPLRGRSAGRATGALRAQRHGGVSARLQSSFVVLELALAFALVASTGLVIRAFARVSSWDAGFDRTGVVMTWLLAPPDRVGTVDAAVDALTRAREAAATVPGILAAGLTSAGPLSGWEESGELRLADRADAGTWPVVWFDGDRGYFETLGVRPRRGRLIAATDTPASPAVAVVNETLVRQVFGAASPLGRRIAVDGYASEIVGVVPDLPPAPGEPAKPAVYWPIRQYRRFAAHLVLRGMPGAALPDASVRRAIAEAAPVVETSSFQPIETLFGRRLVGPRFNMWLAAVFALVAVALSAVGVYAVVAFSVVNRTREIGVRMALGASPRRMTAHFVRRTLRLVGAGTMVGLALAVVAGQGLGSLLFGLPPFDPAVLAGAVAVFVLVAACAGYLPARRASRVDPLNALRAE